MRLKMRARAMPARSPFTRVTPALLSRPRCRFYGNATSASASVVDAVACHRDDLAFRHELADDPILVFGQDVRFHVDDAKLVRDGFGASPLVTFHHHDAQAVALQAVERRLGCRLDGIGDGDDAG
jgi:hypothetical protein